LDFWKRTFNRQKIDDADKAIGEAVISDYEVTRFLGAVGLDVLFGSTL
jgi:hypothetical protein